MIRLFPFQFSHSQFSVHSQTVFRLIFFFSVFVKRKMRLLEASNVLFSIPHVKIYRWFEEEYGDIFYIYHKVYDINGSIVATIMTLTLTFHYYLLLLRAEFLINRGVESFRCVGRILIARKRWNVWVFVSERGKRKI